MGHTNQSGMPMMMNVDHDPNLPDHSMSGDRIGVPLKGRPMTSPR
jgi:hypothetical protein